MKSLYSVTARAHNAAVKLQRALANPVPDGEDPFDPVSGFSLLDITDFLRNENTMEARAVLRRFNFGV